MTKIKGNQREKVGINLPVRFLSVILKLRAQKLLLEKILVPSLRSWKMSLRCWSTSGPKAKLFTNTMVEAWISLEYVLCGEKI